MRERNREENRRMACNSGQSQSDWSLIALKIGEMNANTETDAVSNLLKKLYKELPSDSVFWFLKCWLGSEDTLKDPDSCVISRGDAKGRMRRIDGGKGSDKVWRLDTIVGMLYHGLPMSSTDTNIMVHTCDHELCVRPQHIRFRASSVALVVVLKALAQAGYTIIPPMITADSNGIAANAPDEAVDYRSENLNPASESMSKLTLSASDRELVDMVPVIKDALQIPEITITSTNLNRVNSHPNSYMSYTYRKSHKLDQLRESSNNNTFSPVNDSRHSPIRRSSNGFTCSFPTSKLNSTINSTNCCTTTTGLPTLSDSGSTVCSKDSEVLSLKCERYSLKRPPPDSPSSFPSSPAKVSYNYHPSSSPPLLISEASPSNSRASQIHPQIRRPSDSTLMITGGNISSPLASNTSVSISCSNNSSSAFYAVSMQDNINSLPRSIQSTVVTANVSVSNDLSSHTSNSLTSQSIHTDPDQSFAHHLRSDQQIVQQQQQLQSCLPFTTLPCSSPSLHQPCSIQQSQRNLTKDNPYLCSHPYLGLLVSAPVNGFCIHTPAVSNSGGSSSNSSAGGGGGSIPLISSGCSSSGKSTPRQPAKKRPEARTPTIDGSSDENMICPSSNTMGLSNFDDSHSHLSASSLESTTNAFMVHHNTPFIPVHGRVVGRSSSTEMIHPSLGYINGNPGSNSLSSTTTVTTNSLNNSPKRISDKNHSSSNQLTNNNHINLSTNHNDDDEEEEAEMDQELVDIMVGRNGQSKYTLSHLNNINSQVEHSGRIHYSLINHNRHEILSSEIAASPNGRRVIAAMVAALANVGGSPLMDSSTPLNPRRSASACSLPRFDISPNEDFVDLLSHNNNNGNNSNNNNNYTVTTCANDTHNNHSSRLSSSIHLFSHLNHSQQQQCEQINHSISILNETKNPSFPINNDLNSSSRIERRPTYGGQLSSTPPPPKLLSSQKMLTTSTLTTIKPISFHHDSDLLPKLSLNNNNCTINHTHTTTTNNNNNSNNTNELTLNTKDSPPEESIQELATLLRNSPASGISQELIDMLANMAQQYGMQQSRTCSRASRPSSQVAQHFYRSLVNGSVCGSPFSMTGSAASGFSFLHTPNGGGGGGLCNSGHLTPLNQLNSTTNGLTTCSSNVQSIHHLHSLSFTPLSIDAELVNSQTTNLISTINHDTLTNNDHVNNNHHRIN
ncbi:unnamed protein product [Heterobilharzia americana]|nr:unnamed protein product [Heterobilharzia americana]